MGGEMARCSCRGSFLLRSVGTCSLLNYFTLAKEDLIAHFLGCMPLDLFSSLSFNLVWYLIGFLS